MKQKTGQTAVFFDFDNTLLAGDGAKIGLKYLWDRRKVTPTFILRVLAANVFFKRNLYSAERMAKLLLSLYRGMDHSELKSESLAYYEECIKPNLAPIPMAKLEEHRKAGHSLILLTGSVRYLMEPVVDDLRFDHLICTDLEIGRDGLLTGRSLGKPCIGLVKTLQARELAEKHGFDLGSSYAYGDHISDLSLLRSVGNPVAVQPSRLLKKVAESEHWPILDFC